MFSRKINNILNKRLCHNHTPITSYPKYIESKHLFENQIVTNNQILQKLEEIQTQNQKIDSHNYFILKMLKDLTKKEDVKEDIKKEKRIKFINPIVDLVGYKKCNINKKCNNKNCDNENPTIFFP